MNEDERIESVAKYLAAAIGLYEAEEEHLQKYGKDERRELFCFEVRGHLEQIARLLGLEEENLPGKEANKMLRAHMLHMQREHPEQREFIRRRIERQDEEE